MIRLRVARLRLWQFVSGTLLAASIATAGDARKGEVLYASCVRCHGAKAEGLEEFSAPRLVGREDWYFKDQLKKFRTRQRGYEEPKEAGFLESDARTKLMHPVAEHAKGADAGHLLAYIQLQKPEPIAPVPGGDAVRGQKFYAACTGCHGQNAEGNRRKGAPKLTGQHGWYLNNQLLDFRMGWRGTHDKDAHGKLMRANIDIDDAAIKDLVAYIVSLNKPAR